MQHNFNNIQIKTMKLFIIIFGLLSISIILLSINIIVKKDGKFPNGHVGGNKEMQKRGVKCIQSQDRDERKNL